jgi:hypothetical protein
LFLKHGFVLSRFWAFLDEGSSKTPTTKIKIPFLILIIFFPLTHPPRGHRFFWRPLGAGPGPRLLRGTGMIEARASSASEVPSRYCTADAMHRLRRSGYQRVKTRLLDVSNGLKFKKKKSGFEKPL